MKDIILITAYCPNSKKMDKLKKTRKYSYRVFKNKYDLMLVSHTTSTLRTYKKKLTLCLYDKKNELLTEWDLINQPWFSHQTVDGRIVQSGSFNG